MTTVTPEFQAIYEAGEVLRCDIQNHLSTWPMEKETPLRGDKLAAAFQLEAESLRDRAHQWFNLLALDVLPHTTYDRTHANLLLRRINAAIGGMKYYEEYYPRALPIALSREVPGMAPQAEHRVEHAVSIQVAMAEGAEVMDEALRLIRTAPTLRALVTTAGHSPPASHVPNTAFILMWMDQAHPELVDVH
jgi:hypothetical protein